MPNAKVQYARSGNVAIAYETLGRGPPDLICVWGLVSNLDAFHELPGYDDFLARLAAFGSVTVCDKRGQGLSDRIQGTPSLEERVDDLRAVMDAVGAPRATLIGVSEGGPICALFAAMRPERVEKLVLYGSFGRFSRADDYPWMPPLEDMRRSVPYWGGGGSIRSFAPSLADQPEWRERWARGERQCVSPSAYAELIETNARIDVRSILPNLRLPTLVLHARGDRAAPIENGRYLARTIPGARLVELDGVDHWPVGPSWLRIAAEIEQFVTGQQVEEADSDRLLAAVLFTDIVDSTALLARLGDRRWREELDAHDRIVGEGVRRHRGRVVKNTGDGVLALFDGPARATRCAMALRSELKGRGLEIRAGVHVGEVELRGEDVGGITVHVAARIMAAAAAGEVLASRLVVDLTAGSGLAFAARGEHGLKGIDGSWPLFAAGLQGGPAEG